MALLGGVVSAVSNWPSHATTSGGKVPLPIGDHIGKHRPWERRAGDKRSWHRFSRTPIVTVDLGGWIDVFDTAEDMREYLEWDYEPEEHRAWDASGQRLELQPDKQIAETGVLEPEVLKCAMRAFLTGRYQEDKNQDPSVVNRMSLAELIEACRELM